jgi:hypothetical protein
VIVNHTASPLGVEARAFIVGRGSRAKGTKGGEWAHAPSPARRPCATRRA